VEEDLLKVMEEIRKEGKLKLSINSTFIALIPKSDLPSSYDDFRPIVLCKCLYKIHSKIIAMRLKPLISNFISQEQFELSERQAHSRSHWCSAGGHSHSIKNKIKRWWSLKSTYQNISIESLGYISISYYYILGLS
jgi:hypothetical protein